MLTKLRYAAGEGNSESSSGETSGSSSGKMATQGLQIIGMSATMPNVAAVADWLQVRDSLIFFVHYAFMHCFCLFCYQSLKELYKSNRNPT
jgi:hypothetical protein